MQAMIFPHKPGGHPGSLILYKFQPWNPPTPPEKIPALTKQPLATWAYILWDKNRMSMEKKETETIISNTAMERDRLQKDLEDASARFDELKTISSKKDSTIYARDREIISKKAKIESLLSRNNATESELREARGLIESMNKDIDGYKQQIELLEGQKIQLTREKAAVTEERDIMTRKYDSAQDMIRTREVLRNDQAARKKSPGKPGA
jgi:chromosome segregation ATPase